MSVSSELDIELARRGRVTSRNHAKLGYTRLMRGVYGRAPSTQGLDEWEARRAEFITRTRAVMAAYAHKDPVLFGTTALQVLRVALPERLEDWDHVHISLPPGRRRPLAAGVVAHRRSYPAKVWARVDGLPLQHPVEHWMQLRGATEDELVEVGDGFVRRKNPLLTMEAIRSYLAGCAGRPGSTQVAKALRLVRPRTDSLYETRTRLILVRAGLPEPDVDYEVPASRGWRDYHLDMAYPREKIGVEYDGAEHVANRRQMEIDANRRREIQDGGWIVITVTASQLRQPGPFVGSVESALVLRRGALAAARA